jgi:4-amino-4-deoxy-L-arabinose transferase-like glycosyltransferase
MHETERSAPPFNLLTPSVIAGVAAITLLGLAVRLYGLTSYGLWFDEAYHVELVRLPDVWVMLDAVLSNPPSDPLYVLILRPWVALFGPEAGSIRALSVVFGTATIPATFMLGRYALGIAAGLWGALFFALSPYAIELGQEAALYALAALLTTLALAGGWHWARTGRGMSAYIVAGVLAIYSHYVVAVILMLFAALLLTYLGRDRRERGRWVLANGIVFAAWVPWLVALMLHWLASDLPRAALRHPATPQEVVGALIQFTSGTASLHQGERWLMLAGLASTAVLLLAGWWSGSRAVRHALLLMLALFAVVFAVPAIVSAASGMWLFVSHFMLFLLPALFVCIASGMPSIRSAGPVVWRLAAVGALATWLGVQAWGIVLYNRYPPHGADGLRELAAHVASEHRLDEAVFVTPPALMPTLAQYYKGELTGLPEDFDLRRVYIPYDPSDWHDRSTVIMTATLAAPGQQRFWLVYRPELDGGGRLLSELRERHTLVSEQHYDYADLFLFGVAP